MLLINAGIRIHLFKKYSHTQLPPRTNTNEPSTPKSTRYKDKTPTTPRPKTTTPATNDSPSETPTPVKKTPIKIKSDGPKKDENDKS